MDVPQLLTESEAADWLGVPIEAVALWARDGKLLAAARTEGGQLLSIAGGSSMMAGRWRHSRQPGRRGVAAIGLQALLPTSSPAAVD
jgi:hypothetical protein